MKSTTEIRAEANTVPKRFNEVVQRISGPPSSTSFLHLKEVTMAYLRDYEDYKLNPDLGTREYSLTTVGINARCIRSLFNEADAAKEIDKRHCYPFGRYKGCYQIPAASNPKKALNEAQLGALFHAEVEPGSYLEKARAFWFFSYVASGMNPRDIAFL
jgi:integrase/recombinase XerD